MARFYKSFGKRALDLLVAVPALLVLAPVMLATAAAVAVKLGRPVLFVQERSGYRGRSFTIAKFRSMLHPLDGNGRELSHEERLTPFGRWLRSSSLDELPELISVVKGDMSLVGPRPLLPQYNALYSPRQARRLEVLPGLTGWAQVNGRNAISWQQKFECDVWYVERQSFWLDLRILFATARAVVTRHGIEPDGVENSVYFMGNGPSDEDGAGAVGGPGQAQGGRGR